MKHFETEIEALLRAGKIGAAAQLIGRINLARVPRQGRRGLAKICRRAGLIGKGLRVLHSVVRGAIPGQAPASGAELCEYAVLLSRNGLVPEALSVLEAVDPRAEPEAFLYRGFCHVSNWDYDRAARDFTLFLATDPEPYSRMVARVNLASALIATEQLDAAFILLDELIAEARFANAHRLAGNIYELLAQIHIHRKDFEAANQALRAGLEIFSAGSSYDRILIDKWTSYMASAKSGSTEPLRQFRQRAFSLRHWPSLREADFLSLMIRFDQTVLDHLYFGSPQPAYRFRVEHLLRAQASPYFDWGNKGGPQFELNDGRCIGASGLKVGGKLHLVVKALASDFYEPINTGRMFSLLYPTEHFNVDSSPLRVRQSVKRVRQWISSEKLPIRIVYDGNGYSLIFTGSFLIRLRTGSTPASRDFHEWQRLCREFASGRLFSVRDVIERLGLSRSNFHRLATDAIQNGRLTRSGQGKATRYKLAG